MEPSREDYGDWLIITDSNSVTAFHSHIVDGRPLYYTVTTEFKCRLCEERLPPGVQFRVRFLSVGT